MTHSKKLTFWGIGLLTLTLAVFTFVVLADDDSVLLETDLNAYAPLPENGAESFRQLWEIFESPPAIQLLPWYNGDIADDRYADYLTENAALIRENFDLVKTIVPQLSELAKFNEIGDPSHEVNSAFVSFQGLRAIGWAICQYAELASLQGYDDPGIEELLLFREIIFKWHHHTRFLVHSMLCLTMGQRTHETLELIHPQLDPENLAQIKDNLTMRFAFVESIQRALLSEYCIAASELDKILKEYRGGLGWLLIQRNRSLNIYGTFLRDQLHLAEQQEWEEMEIRSAEFEKELDRFRLVNRHGWTFLSIAIPARRKAMMDAVNAMDAQERLWHTYQNEG